MWKEVGFNIIKESKFIEKKNNLENYFENFSEIDFYKSILSDEILNLILIATNGSLNKKRKALISIEELEIFFAILIATGLKKLSNYKKYWGQKDNFFVL